MAKYNIASGSYSTNIAVNTSSSAPEAHPSVVETGFLPSLYIERADLFLPFLSKHSIQTCEGFPLPEDPLLPTLRGILDEIRQMAQYTYQLLNNQNILYLRG